MFSDWDHDVFVSSPGGPPVAPWVERVFVPELRDAMGREGGAPRARVFHFRHPGMIEVGRPWWQEIRVALLRSAILVPVFAPDYFRSEFCLTEWETFRHRRLVTGASCLYPVRYSDGFFFDEDARAEEYDDFGPFAHLAIRSRASKSFKDRVRLVAETLVHRVENLSPASAVVDIVERRPREPRPAFPLESH